MNTFIVLMLIVAVAGFVAWKKGLLDKFPKPGTSSPPKPSEPVKPSPNPEVPSVETGVIGEVYPSEDALRSFLKRFPGVGMVTLDGEKINSGFGPAAHFTTQMDGSVRR